ncbi:MAG: hypothetical protein H6811_10880 [Phycisphaeraceae bacterium]|nr:hypothetical protein [Phycisphaeraceae bacterium]
MRAAKLAPKPAGSRSLYAALATMAAADIFLTSRILALGGIEVNAIARHALDAAGIPGLAALKAVSVGIVLICCEYIRRVRPVTSLRVVKWGIALNCMPVIAAGAQIAAAAASGRLPMV